MSLKYLLDTNILSEVTRLEPNVRVTQKLSEHQREVGTATVVIDELLYGCLRLAESKKSQFLLAYISQIPLKCQSLITILNLHNGTHRKELDYLR